MKKDIKLLAGATVVDISLSEGGYNYYGYIRTNGEWVIMRENTAQAQYRFKLGADGYSVAWTARTSYTYGLPTIGV